jgi:biopolymer transport protein ExbB/TolQ
MNILSLVEGLLYRLSTIFFYPVILGLFFLLGRIFYSLGVFCQEGWGRFKHGAAVLTPYKRMIDALPVDTSTAAPGMDAGVFSGARSARLELRLADILQEAELKSNRSIQRARYSIKMGPTLGLIGTLTPMARALGSLSAGNLTGLSGQMITAFSTTVLGLIIGGLAYTIAHIRVKWQRQDLFILSRLAEEKLQTI